MNGQHGVIHQFIGTQQQIRVILGYIFLIQSSEDAEGAYQN